MGWKVLSSIGINLYKMVVVLSKIKGYISIILDLLININLQRLFLCAYVVSAVRISILNYKGVWNRGR